MLFFFGINLLVIFNHGALVGDFDLVDEEPENMARMSHYAICVEDGAFSIILSKVWK